MSAMLCRSDFFDFPTNHSNLRGTSIFEWYRILRAHYHWTVFQAIRYALWLAR